MAVQDITNKGATVLGLYATTSALTVAGPIGGTVRIDPDMMSQMVIDILRDADEITVSEAAAPTIGTLPSIPTLSAIGEAITCNPGTWLGTQPITFGFQWRRGVSAIAGATNANYTTVVADVSQQLNCVVTASNSVGTGGAETNICTVMAESPTNTVLPSVSGTAAVGQTLTVSNGTWSGNPAPTFTRQWQRGTTNIPGATANTYILTAADAGQAIRCIVTGSSIGGSNSATSTATAAVTMPPTNSAVPMVSGSARVGQALTANNGVWSGSPAPSFARQWQTSPDGATGWTNIAGATASTYTPNSDDVDSYMRCSVTATNSAGNSTASSLGSGPVIV